MLGMAAPERRVLHRRMAEAARETSTADEATAVGKAIKSLREHAGLSQEDVAERLGVQRQTVSRYETGRPVVLRADVLRRIAAALDVEVDDIMKARGNVVRPAFPGRPAAELRTTVAVHAQPEIGADGEVRYAPAAPSTKEDLGWLFGPAAGFVRLADGALPDGPFSARVAGFDRTVWPRRGQGCVIETRSGELLPRIYERRTEAGVLARGGEGKSEELITGNRIKGVYAIRFWGD